jgi:hypothetical protein
MTVLGIIVVTMAALHLVFGLIWFGQLRAFNPDLPGWLLIVLAALWPWCEWHTDSPTPRPCSPAGGSGARSARALTESSHGAKARRPHLLRSHFHGGDDERDGHSLRVRGVSVRPGA